MALNSTAAGERFGGDRRITIQIAHHHIAKERQAYGQRPLKCHEEKPVKGRGDIGVQRRGNDKPR